MSGSHIVVVLTNTIGDVEGHRVCDKHNTKVAEPSPAVTVVNLSTRWLLPIIVMIPSDQSQNMGEWHYADCLFTTQWLSDHSNVTVVSQPPSGKNDQRYLVYLTTLVECQTHDNMGRMSLRCTSPRWWATIQLRRLLPCRMTLCIHKVRRIGESLHAQTAYVHAIMTPYDSCRRV